MTHPTDAAIAQANDRDMNTCLRGFAMRWYFDGDYIRCRCCDRPQIASRASEVFVHADGCKNGLGAERHPWVEFTRITAPISGHQGVAHDRTK